MTESTKTGTASEAQRSGQARQVRRVTLWSLVVNLALSAVKFLFGVVGASQALVADAVHSLSDSVTDVAIVVGAGFWSAPADAEHPYGHGRIETLITSAIGIVLGGVGVGLGYRAILTLPQWHESRPDWIALAAACLSIVAKELLYRWTASVGKRVKSSALVANAWHHRSDSLSSIAVFIGVTGALIRPSWHILDSFAALVVSLFIARVGFQILGKTLREFTDSAPPAEVIDRISTCIRNVEGVLDTHDLRIRSAAGLYQMETHIVVDGRLTVSEGHRIAKAVESCLEEAVEDLDRVIVHVDPADGGEAPPTGS